MLRQLSFEDIGNVISSPVLQDGLSLSVAPESLMMNHSGRDRARANRIRRRAKGSATTTLETFGPISSGSSASAARCESLANKCRQLLGTVGSMEYRQTWKRKRTPAGRWYWVHTASAAHTKGSDCTGWPSPKASDTTGSQQPPNRQGGVDLKGAAQLTGWPTPEALNHEGYQMMNGIQYPRLGAVAKTASWNTPRATDGSKGGPNQTGGALPADAATAAWPTPTALSFADSHMPGNNRSMNKTVELAAWSSPKANEKIQSPKAHAKGYYSVADQALLASGPNSTSSTAQTERRGVLNPALSRWLQAFPASWDRCSPFWKEWELIQNVLSESSATSETVWQRLAAIALEDFAATETLSVSKRPRRS